MDQLSAALQSFLIDFLPVFLIVVVCFCAWNIAKRVLTTVAYGDEVFTLDSPPETPLERDERLRRAAVAAHVAANQAAHDAWTQEYETIGRGAVYFCPDCGFPDRRHRVTCRAFGAQADETIR